MAQPGSAPLTYRPIWPGAAPGGERVTEAEQEIPRSPTGPKDDTAFLHVRTPTMAHIAPANPNGAAILLVPGGGYLRVAIGNGGRALLQFFADQGYHAYLLKYRLPGDPWAAGPDAPLQDAQRALRLIKAEAKANAIAIDRIGVMGFSAGGHLAAMLAYRSDETYCPVDAVDAQPLGIRVAGLLYPVALMGAPGTHKGSQDQLLGKDPTPEKALRARTDARINAASPPTFIAHAIDDRVVSVDNGLALLAALRRAKRPAEAYLPEIGGHGFGVMLDGQPAPWTSLFFAFAKRHGL
ncbi:alpha/beta hydrolase [Sphingomonas sp. Leaf62]|uniref:alpha/beta hydrolase n=1 Tax=Sphingomonas sp. Leaf62 TaxID=1736228 RepID=UPI001F30064B|nr:alpha/beta hydrolase [Sphingomonas sp. Leaf62]